MKMAAANAVFSVLTLSFTLGISTVTAQEIHSSKVVPSVDQKTTNDQIVTLSAATSGAQLDRPHEEPTQSDPENYQHTQNNEDVVVLAGVATTARIADPNERVVFNGHVMRMADFVAAVSSGNEVVRHLHIQEKRNHEKD
ncbi:MAG: hypothetical protein ABSG32_24810 [Terriglobia bacterium]|jgi:hypothetical protein